MSLSPACLASAAVALLCTGATMAYGRTVTLAEARAAAEAGGLDVQLADLRTGLARAEVWVAGALANPTFGATSAKETAHMGFSLAVPVPIFGQRRTAVATAKADASAAAADAVVVRTDARWNATQAWLDLYEAQARTKQLALSAKQSERLEEIAALRFDAGRGSRVDVVRAHAERARAQAELAASARLIRAASVRLGLFFPEGSANDLSAADDEVYDGGAQPIDDLLGRLSSHPTLRRDRLQVAARDLQIKRERRARLPLVNFQLTVNSFDPTLPAPDVIGGLSFELPMLSVRGGAIASAQAQRALAEATAIVDNRRLWVSLVDAWERSEAARGKLMAIREEVLPSVEEAKRMTDEAYESGRVELIRLLDVQRALVDARLAEIDAFSAWARAVADLERAAGVDLRPRQP